MGAAGGRHKGHGRGDVETVRPVAAGAAGVDQGQGRPGRREVRGLPQHLGHGCQFLAAGPLGPQGRQQGAGEHRIDLLGQPALHQAGGLGGAERLPVQQLLQQDWPGLGRCHRVRPEKSPGAMHAGPGDGDPPTITRRGGNWRCPRAISSRSAPGLRCRNSNQPPHWRREWPWLPAENPPPRWPWCGCAAAGG